MEDRDSISGATIEIGLFRVVVDVVQEERSQLRAQGVGGEVDQSLEVGPRGDWADTVE